MRKNRVGGGYDVKAVSGLVMLDHVIILFKGKLDGELMRSCVKKSRKGRLRNENRDNGV